MSRPGNFCSTQLNRKSVDLSQIRYDSTCNILEIPLSLACLTCQPKLYIHTKKGRHLVLLDDVRVWTDGEDGSSITEIQT